MDSPSDPLAGSASTSSVVDRYQQHCQSGAMPDLAAFVASVSALDPRDLAALVHVDQRHRHAAGAPRPAESYFESFPALGSDTELALDVVYQEYVLRRDAGEAYSTDKYLSRFPDLAEQLAMQFELDGAMGDEHSSRSMNTARKTVEHSSAYPPGTLIAGRYKLLEEIGEGGMGTVWVAQQTEPVRRRVAIKLIKPGMDSRQVLSRFEAERQALAIMDHPHIAKVLDGGLTDEGRPYFVMEYVKGEPITDYCDKARLSVTERLKLFVQVCQAVQHAHQKGIIHRDLKPSNILVCPYDGQPVPKVIDFGLAKAMHQSLTEHSLYTAHGVMVGTPLYMSPEQAETNNLDIDTRSDLYSLGVILYELLTGSTPLEKRRLHDAAFQEMLRLIQEEEPPKPSTRLSGSGSLPTIAAQRSLEPAQLSRTVQGDLDWIVMKSLEKERSRRYETANGLARDIERYLHDDPVEARPPSAGYRFSKFARRNKGAMLTVGLVAAALVVGTIASTWQAIRATRAEQLAQDERLEAERQRAEAEANFKKAKAAVDKYFTLVSESTLFDVPGLEPLRKDLLEAAAEFYEGAALERTDDPALLADLATTHLRVGEIYRVLNRPDDWVAAIGRALNVIDRLRREHPAPSEYERKLAGFWQGLRVTVNHSAAPRDVSATSKTLLHLEKTWTLLAERHPTQPAFRSDLAAIRALTGWVLADIGRPIEGIAMFRQALAVNGDMVREFPGVAKYRADRVAGLNILVGILNGQKHDVKELLSLQREAVQLGEELVAEYPNVAAHREILLDCHYSLAHLIEKAQPDEAEEAFRRSVELSEVQVREFPGHSLHWVRLGRNAGDWAAFEAARGNRTQAEDIVRKVIETYEEEIEIRPGNREARIQLVIALGRLVELLVATGRHEEADASRQRVPKICEPLLAEHPQDRQARERLSWTLSGLADKLQLVPDVREPVLRKALALHAELADEATGDRLHFEQTGHLYCILARYVRAKGKLDEAHDNFEKGADVFAQLAANQGIPQRDGYYRAYHGDTFKQIAIVLGESGHAQEAGAAARQCVDIYEGLVNDFPDNLDYRRKLVGAVRILNERLVAAGQFPEAVQARRQQISFLEKLQRAHPQKDFKPLLAGAYLALTVSLTKSGAVGEAKQVWEKAVEVGQPDANWLNQFAWSLVTDRNVEPALADLAVQVALQATNAAPNNSNYWNTLGVARYRARQWKDAIGSLAKAEELAPDKTLAFNGFFLAMAHWQLDHKDESRKWYDRSVEWMEKNQPKNEELVRFRAEAKQLLGITQPGSTPNDAPQGEDAAKPPS